MLAKVIPTLIGSTFARAIVLGLVYWLAVNLAVELIDPVDNIALFWPPNAIVAAALIFSSRKHWPLYLIAMALAFIAPRVPGYHFPLHIYFGLCAANIIEILIVAGLVRRFAGDPPTAETLTKVLSTAILASIPASFASALIGSVFITSAIENATVWSALVGWFTSGLSGLLLVLPVLLVWLAPGAPFLKSYNKNELIERFCIAATFIAIGLSIPVYMAEEGQVSLVFPYLVFPVLIWTAIRLGLRSTATATLAVGLFAIALTYLGYGPFNFEGLSAFGQVVGMKVGLITITLTTFFLAVAVTERRQAEEALKASEQRQRIVLESAQDGIITIDDTGKTVAFNPAAESIFGLRSDEIRGKDLAETIIPPSLREKHRAGLQRYLETGEHNILDQRIEITALRASGEEIPVELTVTPYTIDGRQYFSGFLRDISERKRAQEGLQAALSEAETANRTKTEFLANMSHELRTPLNAIIGFSEIIKVAMFGPLESKYQDYASDISDSGEHLLGIIADILDVSKVEAGELDIEKEEVDLGETAAACETMVSGRAEEAGVTLTFDVAADLPPLHADPTRLKQVLLNLITNAIKFTPEGGRVTVTGETNGDGGVVLVVRDTGVGIAKEDIPKVLEKFGQVRDGHMQAHEGAGLGLALAKTLMELHGGTLEIESEVGKGTMVTVTFPPERIKKPPGRHTAWRT